ncbi:MAG: hypothetical protein JRE64_26535 [Deltaproteobacteria bacterium]|nr:hypothetical protein [Deltaproteobacteria bacterium]
MKKFLLISVAFFALAAFNVTVGPTDLQAQHIVLYGTEIDNDTLFTIDLTNGVATTLGALVPPAQIEGLAFNPDSGSFYGTDNSNHTLIEISTDPVSWSVAQVLPYGTYSNIARNPITGTYYTHFNNTDTLSTVDPVTGAVVPEGPSSGVYMQSLAFDYSGRLFGIGDIPAPGQEALYELDVLTGAILSTTEITSNLINPRFDNSLSIHPETGVFYTVAAIEGGLYEVDPLTGVATRVGYTGLRNIRSLDFAVVGSTPVPEPCTIDIHPDTLNKKSKGKYITCYIELPEAYSVEDIDIDTVMLKALMALLSQ